MSNKINMTFFKSYLELDEECNKLLGISKGGVSAYIGRLVELRFAPERSEVLPKLIKYRKIRNTIAHEVDAFEDLDEITKEDIKWIGRFTKSVSSKRDPVSRYERKAKRYATWRKVRVVLILLGIIVAALATFFVVNGLMK